MFPPVDFDDALSREAHSFEVFLGQDGRYEVEDTRTGSHLSFDSRRAFLRHANAEHAAARQHFEASVALALGLEPDELMTNESGEPSIVLHDASITVIPNLDAAEFSKLHYCNSDCTWEIFSETELEWVAGEDPAELVAKMRGTSPALAI
jgi:hypothetical protein